MSYNLVLVNMAIRDIPLLILEQIYLEYITKVSYHCLSPFSKDEKESPDQLMHSMQSALYHSAIHLDIHTQIGIYCNTPGQTYTKIQIDRHTLKYTWID